MKKHELLILAIITFLAFWALFLPNKDWVYHQLSPKDLHYQLNKTDKYWSVEQVAQAIVEKRPDVIIIDVRDSSQYKSFALIGALNIPYDSLLFNTNNILHSPEYKKILYSNGTTLAEKCWLMATRAGLQNIYIMEGGLNKWFDNILNPQAPSEPATEEQVKLYQYRKGLRAFFVGDSNTTTPANQQTPAIVPVQQKENKSKLGGCS